MPLMTFHYVTMYWEGLKSSKKYREIFQSVFLKSGEKSGKNSDRPERPLHHQPHNTLFVQKKKKGLYPHLWIARMLESRRHPGRRIARHHCSLHTSKQGRQSQRSRGPRPCGEVMSEMSFGCNPAWMIFFGLRWLDNHKQTKRLFRRKRPMWNRMILWWQWIEWLQLRDETSWGRFFFKEDNKRWLKREKTVREATGP